MTYFNHRSNIQNQGLWFLDTQMNPTHQLFK